MRVKNESRAAARGVSDIWEIRLDKELIATIRKLARQRGVTMSWLARYCIFRLVHKKIIHKEKFQDIVDEIRATRPPFRELGRFYLCLYGDDILWIKMQAQQMNVTVSMLIRVALLRYMASLGNERAIPWWRLFWYGLKLNKQVEIHRQRANRCHVQEFLNCRPFDPKEYWKIPPGPLPYFLCN